MRLSSNPPLIFLNKVQHQCKNRHIHQSLAECEPAGQCYHFYQSSQVIEIIKPGVSSYGTGQSLDSVAEVRQVSGFGCCFLQGGMDKIIKILIHIMNGKTKMIFSMKQEDHEQGVLPPCKKEQPQCRFTIRWKCC